MDIKPYRRKANYYETDQMSIIHHSNYIRWFEEARVDLMDQLGYGYEKSVAAGIEFALLSLSCEYKSMVRFGDTVDIFLRVTQLTNVRLSLGYEVRDTKSGILRTTGETTHCFYDGKRGRPIALKKALPELFVILREVYEEQQSTANSNQSEK